MSSTHIAAMAAQGGLQTGAATQDAVERVDLSLVILPLARPISDAKVLTGRQKPLTEIAFLFAEIKSKQGHEGVGFSYSKRAGGQGLMAHGKEIADSLLGEDPNDISRVWEKLLWAGASMGRSGLSVQAIAAFDNALWDMKAKRAGLPLAKLLGAHRDAVDCYNTSGGYLSSPIAEVLANVEKSLEKGIGGIKIKVGQPDVMADLARVRAVHKLIDGRVHLMVDANQQWDRVTALRFGKAVEELGLTWIEEPLDAWDAQGHADLAAQLVTPIATGEMLTSVAEHLELLRLRSVDFIQPDAPRVGGVSAMLKIMAMAEQARVRMAPHFAMEIHLHLSAAYPHGPWVEHFEWLEPMFNEKLEIRNGQMWLPKRPGLGFSLSQQARLWTVQRASFSR